MYKKNLIECILNYKKIVYLLPFFVGFLFLCDLILFDYIIEPVWEFFPDSNDYITQSKYSLFSLDFYSPIAKDGFAPRPFTIPLFLKLVGSNPYNMVIFHRIFYCFCVFIFILAISKNITNTLFKITLQFFLLYLFSWWDIIGWSNNVVSESISTSLMILWFASILFYFDKPNITRLIIMTIISLLFSFTRDTWPYIILLFAILNFSYFYFIKASSIKLNFYFLLFTVILFFTQNKTSNIGERYKLPIFNSIVGRVSHNDDYIKWFSANGMPLEDTIVSNFKDVDVDTDIGKPIIYNKYYNKTYTPLFDWIKKDGKAVFQKFLISHPSYLAMSDQDTSQINRIFCKNLYHAGYYQYPQNYYLNPDAFFPFFKFWQCVLLMMMMIFLYIITKYIKYFFIAMLFFLFSCNAIMSYNADTLEVNRHLYTTQIVMQILCIISFFMVIDYIWAFLFKKFIFELNKENKE